MEKREEVIGAANAFSALKPELLAKTAHTSLQSKPDADAKTHVAAQSVGCCCVRGFLATTHCRTGDLEPVEKRILVIVSRL